VIALSFVINKRRHRVENDKLLTLRLNTLLGHTSGTVACLLEWNSHRNNNLEIEQPAKQQVKEKANEGKAPEERNSRRRRMVGGVVGVGTGASEYSVVVGGVNGSVKFAQRHISFYISSPMGEKGDRGLGYYRMGAKVVVPSNTTY